MSVKIKLSYGTDQELAGVIRLLSPALKDYKIARNKQGRYKKTYADLGSDRFGTFGKTFGTVTLGMLTF